jgi:hypothetical protein
MASDAEPGLGGAYHMNSPGTGSNIRKGGHDNAQARTSPGPEAYGRGASRCTHAVQIIDVA